MLKKGENVPLGIVRMLIGSFKPAIAAQGGAIDVQNRPGVSLAMATNTCGMQIPPYVRHIYCAISKCIVGRGRRMAQLEGARNAFVFRHGSPGALRFGR